MSVVLDEGGRSFASLLRARRIAVAGPARTLEGAHQGALIDSFDLVVRFNEVFLHLDSDYCAAVDTGRRADIVYANQVVLRRHALDGRGVRRRFAAAMRARDVQAVVCTNNSMSFGEDGSARPSCPRADRHVVTDLARLVQDEGLACQVRVLSGTSLLAHRWLEGQWGRTGCLALLDLVLSEAARIYVTGMTLYHGGGHVMASPAAILHPLKNRDGSWAQSAEGVGHDSYREREMVCWLARFYRHRLSVDEDLLKILGYTTGREPWPAESHTSSASSTAEPF